MMRRRRYIFLEEWAKKEMRVNQVNKCAIAGRETMKNRGCETRRRAERRLQETKFKYISRNEIPSRLRVYYYNLNVNTNKTNESAPTALYMFIYSNTLIYWK